MTMATWASLGHLDLRWAGIDAIALAALAKADWPALYQLCLDGNGLSADAILCLVAASLSKLKRLWLSENKLDAAASHRQLEWLALQDTNLDNDAMKFLAQGQWPNLGYLDLNAINDMLWVFKL